jgi:SAM-dependent methyltransferase
MSHVGDRIGRTAQIRGRLPFVAPSLMRFGLYWPHNSAADSYSRPTGPARSSDDSSSSLPVPPEEFRADYGTSVEVFLASGREDCATMRRLLAESGFAIEGADRILELGCAGGRMLRWLVDLAPKTQLWGTDIWSSAILWCQDNLTPPCYFATNTVVPHLPFEDRSFDLVYCGSVFTHIDDLAEAWFLELHRILRPGGRLYFSVNDRHAVAIFDGRGKPEDYPRYYERLAGGKAAWDEFVAENLQRTEYQRFRQGDAYMVSMGRSGMAHVMWDSAVLCRRLEYGYRLCAITPEAYGHQTTVLLERV